MRKNSRRTMAVALAAVTCLAGLATGTAGAADAAHTAGDDDSPRPAGTSKFVLAVGHSGVTGVMVPERVVTLECGPYVPDGDHPKPLRACDDLTRAGGDLRTLADLNRDGICTKEYNPITVTVDGYWKNRRINFDHTFPNPCLKRLNASALFQF
ncbi:SSI family serine proteinase inhibitor [Streptomyces boncukensis]|uniref:Subtilisin inhibitor domain-containing protein n=1 Tax=Streptomyces boncukensis TaxID=2711219 RepID=A0A6G4XAM1_9ACTN|nr:SSI family serine proteinase inhibitor [Streptomyces boncukensis]NGO73794.1 hypothetical protein [Streptomyces boncukensis]